VRNCKDTDKQDLTKAEMLIALLLVTFIAAMGPVSDYTKPFQQYLFRRCLLATSGQDNLPGRVGGHRRQPMNDVVGR